MKKFRRAGKAATALIILVAIVLIIYNFSMVFQIFYPVKYKEFISKYSTENGIDPYLVLAVIKAESGFDPDAVSVKNARGLMQITDKTGVWAAEKIGLKNFKTEDLYDPETNISLGCWYLNWLMQYYNGNTDLVIAAYNGGNGNVNEWLKDRNLSSSGKSLEKIPFKETDEYLKKVKRYHSVYKKLYAGEF